MSADVSLLSPVICRPRAHCTTGNLFVWGPFITCEHFFDLMLPVFKQFLDAISYGSVECKYTIFYYWILPNLLTRRPDDPSVGLVSQGSVVLGKKDTSR